MTPPIILAPIKTGNNSKRPVRASGEESAAKAMRCTSYSLPSSGQSISKVRVSVTASVRGMSRYLRIRWDVSGVSDKGMRRPGETLFAVMAKAALKQGFGGSDKTRVRAVEFIRSSFDFPNSRL